MVTTKSVTMVATLGGQPQVVTFALDALLDQGIPVTRLLLLYLPTDEVVERSLERLEPELGGGTYRGRELAYAPEPVRNGSRTVVDICNEADADDVWQCVNSRVAQLKTEDHILHICITGGRKLLGMLTMSAAMMHFGHHDGLWHMYTPAEVIAEAQGGALMHLPPNTGFSLIRVPMMPWGAYFPTLRELARPLASADVFSQQRRVLDYGEQARCRTVVTRLTRRQQDVLELLAAGQNPQQVAASLGLKVSTVDSHKSVILIECRNAWNLPEETWLDYRFVREKFANFEFAA